MISYKKNYLIDLGAKFSGKVWKHIAIQQFVFVSEMFKVKFKHHEET